ncbi:MAG: trimethylamine methyltransferase family protein, partial [Candidatus Puniceispirillales bacterium]
MARRASSSRVRGVRPEQAISAPYVKRILPFFDPLDTEQIEKLEQQVDWLIENIGIAFRDDPSSIELWKKAGAKVDGDIVHAPADWIRDLCRKAPSQFTQLARNPARSVVIGGDN